MLREWLGILIISGSVATQGYAAAQPESRSATTAPEVLDEVQVRGTRLNELKAAIVVAEDRFYARYNELNEVDVFDIECSVDAPIGTKIPQRLCLTKLQRKAESEHGREYLKSLQDMSLIVGGDMSYGKPTETDPNEVWAARYDEYRRNMLSLMKKHPELRQLAREGEEAKKRYNAEYKRRVKGRLILVE